jgi:proton-translocating NADH-quinone oxidoreductase chain L
MFILIIFFPLFGFFSGIFLGGILGSGVSFLTTFLVFLSFVLSFFLFYKVTITGYSIKIILGSWILVDKLNIQWCFLFDSLTSVMLIVVTFISTLVHLYSIEYMKEDPHVIRFMSYLSLFTFFMLILISANNFLQMFVGWEGVGLSSYLLINFWFTRIQANKSAIKAMLVNRIGDFFILLGMFLIYYVFSTLDYDVIFNLYKELETSDMFFGNISFKVLDLICLFLFFGAMGKSAQIGLHVWLPDAMEGPTPVSALIHAATMVTAGVFLITRCSFLFESSPFVLNLITIIGSLTAFFASTTGLFQNDIKKVIAYSTCSQLGYMVFACGLSCYEVGIFHLFNHAFFKALLFLGAGSVIHALSDEQDMRKMGGLKQLLPFSYAIIVIGSLALIGFPFLSGYYSKDIILELAYARYTNISQFSFFLGNFAAFFTACYSTRLIILVFLTVPNGNKISILSAHEGSWKMVFSLLILSFLSLFVGYLTKDIFIGFGTDFWGSSIYVSPKNYLLIDIEFINLFFKLLPLILTLSGIITAIVLYIFDFELLLYLKKKDIVKWIYFFFNKKWYFDRIYNTMITKNILYFGYFFPYKEIDRGILELFGPYGIINVLNDFTMSLKKYQSGNIFHYLFLFFSLVLNSIKFTIVTLLVLIFYIIIFF